MQDPLLPFVLEEAFPWTTRRPAPGGWNNLHDLNHERVARLSAYDRDRPGQGMSPLLVLGVCGRLVGRPRHHDRDQIRIGGGDRQLPRGDIASDRASGRLQCLEDHRVAGLYGQAGRQGMVPEGVDGLSTKVMRSPALLVRHSSSLQYPHETHRWIEVVATAA